MCRGSRDRVPEEIDEGSETIHDCVLRTVIGILERDVRDSVISRLLWEDISSALSRE